MYSNTYCSCMFNYKSQERFLHNKHMLCCTVINHRLVFVALQRCNDSCHRLQYFLVTSIILTNTLSVYVDLSFSSSVRCQPRPSCIYLKHNNDNLRTYSGLSCTRCSSMQSQLFCLWKLKSKLLLSTMEIFIVLCFLPATRLNSYENNPLVMQLQLLLFFVIVFIVCPIYNLLVLTDDLLFSHAQA